MHSWLRAKRRCGNRKYFQLTPISVVEMLRNFCLWLHSEACWLLGSAQEELCVCRWTECGLTSRDEGRSIEHSRLCDLSRSVTLTFPPIDYLSIPHFHLPPLHFPPSALLWEEHTLAISFCSFPCFSLRHFHTLPQLEVGHHCLFLSQSPLSPLLHSSFHLVNLTLFPSSHSSLSPESLLFLILF